MRAIVLGHTRVSENWHLFYTGSALFFGSSEYQVVAKAKRHRFQQQHKAIAREYQEEALSFRGARA